MIFSLKTKVKFQRQVVPREVANFLKLENPDEYSGFCLLRPSAILLVDAGDDIYISQETGRVDIEWCSGGVHRRISETQGRCGAKNVSVR